MRILLSVRLFYPPVRDSQCEAGSASHFGNSDAELLPAATFCFSDHGLAASPPQVRGGRKTREPVAGHAFGIRVTVLSLRRNGKETTKSQSIDVVVSRRRSDSAGGSQFALRRVLPGCFHQDGGKERL